MSIRAKILNKAKTRMQAVFYGNPLYRFMLESGHMPERLRLSLTDLWPGGATAGQALIADEANLFENLHGLSLVRKKQVLAHEWLRDLRAVGTETARHKAVGLLEEWLTYYDEWREDSWAPDVLGERLVNWVRFHDFYATCADDPFKQALIASMVRQLRHLLRTMPVSLTGAESLRAICGLITGGISLLDSEKALSLAFDLLQRQLATEILPDGGHIARCPSIHLNVLRSLIDIRAALRAASLEVPPELATAIERMVPALKLYRHGDGGLALFNGGHEGSALGIDATITMSEARGRVMRRLPITGYERVTAGRSLLLMDVREPPPRPYDHCAHAGLLSFEFSIGRERLIVNCGAGPAGDAEWRLAMAATAAHSTVTVDDMNACEILPEGGIGHRPREVAAQRYEQDGMHFIEATHDGYENKHRISVRRALRLSADGEELQGCETLAGPPHRPFALRWHLHPSVQATLVQGGQAALLRTPSGSGWRLRVANGSYGGAVSLESSIYCGGPSPSRALQIKVTGHTSDEPTHIEWTLAREKKTP